MKKKLTGISKRSKNWSVISGRVGKQDTGKRVYNTPEEAAKAYDKKKAKEYYKAKKIYDDLPIFQKMPGRFGKISRDLKVEKPNPKKYLLNFPEDYPDENFGSYFDEYLKKQKTKQKKSKCKNNFEAQKHNDSNTTLINLVDQIKKAMGYSNDINLPNTLSKAILDLQIEITDKGAQTKANCIAKYLGIESRC